MRQQWGRAGGQGPVLCVLSPFPLLSSIGMLINSCWIPSFLWIHYWDINWWRLLLTALIAPTHLRTFGHTYITSIKHSILKLSTSESLSCFNSCRCSSHAFFFLTFPHCSAQTRGAQLQSPPSVERTISWWNTGILKMVQVRQELNEWPLSSIQNVNQW